MPCDLEPCDLEPCDLETTPPCAARSAC